MTYFIILKDTTIFRWNTYRPLCQIFSENEDPGVIMVTLNAGKTKRLSVDVS